MTTSFVIEKHTASNTPAQGFLVAAQNGDTAVPTVYICKRKSLIVLHQGSIDLTNSVTFGDNGDITVTKNTGYLIFYRMWVME